MNVLSSNNSYPKVGTAVHNINGATVVRCNVRIVNVRDNFINLLGGSIRAFSRHDLSNVLGLNNAVLKASHRGPFHGLLTSNRDRGPRLVERGCRRLNLSYLIYVNNGKARGATNVLSTVNLGIVNIPGAVSGSV